MTATPLILLALVAMPVVLLLATAGCGLGPIGTPLPPDTPLPPQPTPVPQPPGSGPTPTPTTPPTYSELVLSRAGLVGYWRLDEPSAIFAAPNPKAVNSHTPNTLDGNYDNTFGITLQQDGALRNDPNKDKAALFSGGYVEVPYSPPLNPSSLTLELWMRLEADLGSWQVLAGCYAPQPLIDTTIARGYRLRARTKPGGGGAIEIEALLDTMPAPMIGEISSGAQRSWHHIALVYNPSVPVAQLFIDVDATKKPAQESHGKYLTATGPNRPLRFAADQQLVVSTYHGLLDEIALYGDCLSGGDLHEHFVAATT